MNWDTLIAETARRADASPDTTAQTLNSFFDTIMEIMETDDVIQLREDFGSFEMREAGGSTGVHPASFRKTHRTPVFKKSAALKKQLRQSDQAYLQTLRENGRSRQADMLEQRTK